MSKPIEEILAAKPEARPRIYAYSIDDRAHKGLLKIGQTTRNVKQRVAEQLKTAAIKNCEIELEESAERDDGTIFSDHAMMDLMSNNENFALTDSVYKSRSIAQGQDSERARSRT
jgi:hypothetical protein